MEKEFEEIGHCLNLCRHNTLGIWLTFSKKLDFCKKEPPDFRRLSGCIITG